MNPEMLRYITANRDTYSRGAITRQLIFAGHDPAEIEQAWESIEPTLKGGLPRDRTVWRYFTIYIAVLYGLTFVVYALRGVGVTLILGVFLLLGAWISILLVRSSPAVATGAASGLMIAVLIPFVFLMVIAGLCSMMTGGYPFADQEGSEFPPVTYNLTLYGQAPEGQALVLHESSCRLDEETGYFYLPVCGADLTAAPGEPLAPCPVGESGGGERVSIGAPRRPLVRSVLLGMVCNRGDGCGGVPSQAERDRHLDRHFTPCIGQRSLQS